MSTRVGALIAIGMTMVLCVPSPSRGEDLGLPPFISYGAQFDAGLARTIPNTFMTAIPGGTFVFTVAHIAPSPEESMHRGKPVKCDSAKFRIDTLRVSPTRGDITVQLGIVKELAPGEAAQVRLDVDPTVGVGLPTFELDQLGFRFRADKSFSNCNMVASGMFYPTSRTQAPIPVALIPSVVGKPREH